MAKNTGRNVSVDRTMATCQLIQRAQVIIAAAGPECRGSLDRGIDDSQRIVSATRLELKISRDGDTVEGDEIVSAAE